MRVLVARHPNTGDSCALGIDDALHVPPERLASFVWGLSRGAEWRGFDVDRPTVEWFVLSSLTLSDADRYLQALTGRREPVRVPISAVG